MSDVPRSGGVVTGDRYDVRWYAGVIIVEVLVLVGIWLFQRYFGA